MGEVVVLAEQSGLYEIDRVIGRGIITTNDFDVFITERDEFLTRCVYAFFELMYVHTSVPFLVQRYLGACAQSCL